jgi:hypothetical protein
MKTSANRDLFEYWNKRRGHRIAPERGDIQPDAIRHVLGDSFFLSADDASKFPFRLAGTRVCAMFGRELKNDSFFNLWGKSDQAALRKLMNVVVDEKVGVVAHATGRTTDGGPLVVNLELLLLPLLQRGPLDARVLGTFVPLTTPFWLGTKFVGPLELGALRHVGPTVDRVPAPPLVVSTPITTAPSAPTHQNGLKRRGLVVYEGGRRD